MIVVKRLPVGRDDFFSPVLILGHEGHYNEQRGERLGARGKRQTCNTIFGFLAMRTKEAYTAGRLNRDRDRTRQSMISVVIAFIR